MGAAVKSVRSNGPPRRWRKPKRRGPAPVQVSYRCPRCGGPHHVHQCRR